MILHHLRFNTETRFTFDPVDKQYSIRSGGIVYTMPYVVTLRLKRYLKGHSTPNANQLSEWYNTLPIREKSLVTLSGAQSL